MPFGLLRHNGAAFTLVEVLFSVAILAISMLATLSMLMFIRVENSLEQERARASQIVCKTIEDVQTNLASLANSSSVTIVWDNGTPDNPADDTQGTLEVTVRDLNGVQLSNPQTAKLVIIEVTLSWTPRGRLSGKTMRESAMTYVSPGA